PQPPGDGGDGGDGGAGGGRWSLCTRWRRRSSRPRSGGSVSRSSPATSAQVDNVLRVLRGRTGTLVDIGSGDGRIVISAALQGFQASGLELNPWLVWFSRCRALRAGVHHRTSFHISDLWKVNLSQYSNVVIFGVPQMMDELEQKLADELEVTAKVVACRFPFPSWAPERTAGEGIDTVWLYDAKTFKTHRSHGATGGTVAGGAAAGFDL
ncbi:unnamed protein product, partial [Lampetra planeri]